MATENKNIWFYSSPDGTPPPIRTYQMTAAQGILNPGAALMLETAGTCDRVATDDIAILGYLVGVVDQSIAWPLTAALSAGDEVRVAIARAGDVYAGYADADGTDCVVAQAMVGDALGITATGTVGHCTVNTLETSNTLFNVVDLMFNVSPEKNALANNPGVLLVKHISSKLQG